MYTSLPQRYPVETAPSYEQESIWNLVSDLERDYGAETNNSFAPWDLSENPLTDPLETDLFLPANAAAGRAAASGFLGGGLAPPAGAVGYELPPAPGHGSYGHTEGDQSLDHLPFCADISTATPTNGAVPCQLPMGVGVGHSASSSATRPDCQDRKSAQGSELPQGPGHGSHVHMVMEGFCTDISTAQNGAVLEAGSVEDDIGPPRRRRRRRLIHGVVGHGEASSSAKICPGLHSDPKSAQGFIQPDTGTVCGRKSWSFHFHLWCRRFGR
jgi:hypothetical protein